MKTNGRAVRNDTGTTPSTTNLFLEPGKTTPEDLLKGIGRGFYVTDLIGHGVNDVNGDYRTGASEYWIENGKMTFPVSEVIIAGNLMDKYSKLTAANDLDDRYSICSPTLAIEGMIIGGR